MGVHPRAECTLPFFYSGVSMAEAATTVECLAQSSAPKNRVLITEGKCKGCELCVVTCPQGCLVLAHDRLNPKGYHPAEFEFDGEKGACTACGICFLVCPDGAITAIEALNRKEDH